jgi:hypothetical protein
MADKVLANSPYYNDIPETRGICRNKGTYNGATAQDTEDAAKLAAFLTSQEDESDDAAS